MEYDQSLPNGLRIAELDIAPTALTPAFPVLRQLRPHLDFDAYIALVDAMKTQGYRVFCLFEHDQVVAYIGFAKQVNLYYGNFVWVYDLVTDEVKQGKGYGKLLLSCVETLAREEAQDCIVLSSGFAREGAHKFYENAMDYQKISYVFKKDLR